MKDEIFFEAIRAAFHAGKAIMEVYTSDFSVEYKADESPLTQADTRAHRIISEALEPFGLPMLSEEGKHLSYEERQAWGEYWLVDPLDGTKDFIKRNGDFTVNIAVVKLNKAVAGVIYAPVRNDLYFALPGHGAFRINLAGQLHLAFDTLPELIADSIRLPNSKHEDRFVIVASKSHRNQETDSYISKIQEQRMEDVEYVEVGSSLKFCCMAEGSASLYPRLGPTMEWDTAAGHAIAEIAGCSVNEIETGNPLVYNKENLLNPWFVVRRK